MTETNFQLGNSVRIRRSESKEFPAGSVARRVAADGTVGTIATVKVNGYGVLFNGEEQALFLRPFRLEHAEPTSIREATLAILKNDRERTLARIGTNQTTVETLNDKIEIDTAIVQQLDDLIRDIER